VSSISIRPSTDKCSAATTLPVRALATLLTANLNLVSQARLDEIATKLNTRPRQKLGFKTPADILDDALR